MLETQVQQILSDAKARVRTAKAIRPVLDVLQRMQVSENQIGLDLGGDYAYVRVLEDLDKTTDYLMYAFKYAFHLGPEWQVQVSENEISHRVKLNVKYRGHSCRVWLTLVSREKTDGSCQIIAVPTGRKTTRTVWKDEEIDEVEYKVQCA